MYCMDLCVAESALPGRNQVSKPPPPPPSYSRTLSSSSQRVQENETKRCYLRFSATKSAAGQSAGHMGGGHPSQEEQGQLGPENRHRLLAQDRRYLKVSIAPPPPA